MKVPGIIAKIISHKAFGGPTSIAGIVITAGFITFSQLPILRGSYVPTYIFYFLIAGFSYAYAVYRLDRDDPSLNTVWLFAVIFQLTMLFTSPSLSDDVYRYIWDGHLLNNGINPYTTPVKSPLLDDYDTPLRHLVNHDWMASPYLPTSQIAFAIITRIAPQSTLAFQISSALCNLLTGWIIMSLLKRMNLPSNFVLVYLWNPLVIIEFAHSAHMDSLMNLLIMLAFLFFFKSSEYRGKDSGWNEFVYLSIICLAAATLTKLLPLLLIPIMYPKWGWKGSILYSGFILTVLSVFSAGAGWGLTGPLNGTGVFGAIRIYANWWNYNSGLYHWLEVLLSGYQTPGAVPVELVGETPILIAKVISTVLLVLAFLITGLLTRRLENDEISFLRIAIIPFGAYLLFTPTLHPWYVTLIIPFLAFLMNKNNEIHSTKKLIWPWIYLSIAVSLSYLTYIDPDHFREYGWVRLVEYIPFYFLLIWAFFSTFWKRKNPGFIAI